ncbi:MAG: hypothetical protein M9949_04640 [Candidatus Kapabacteria bacterium]|nr:hypothetical protein [Candidatus Kapabacteria bacterium]
MGIQRIQLKAGVKANLPNSDMLAGEAHVTTDRGTLHVAVDPTTRIIIVPAIEDLVTLASLNLDTDFVIIHDADGTGQKEKKMTLAALKTALNIPEASADEKVAVVSGGTAGYLYGTDGSDGVVRMGSSLKWTKDAGNGFVTLEADVINGGTF